MAWLIDPPANGPWNMAVDELLLDEAVALGCPAGRFYQWDQPTLSLGYFQAAKERNSHAASRPCPVVRRLTGGGAIVHDHELTYSLALPASHPLAAARHRLYEIVHASLLEVLARWSIHASLHPAGGSLNKNQPEPFLCFQRRAFGDVVLDTAKVAGSAQRRRRGAVLQHGSILLASSTAAPELPSLADITGRVISPAQLIDAWLPRLGELIGLERQVGVLDDERREVVWRWAKSRYNEYTDSEDRQSWRFA